MKKKLFIFIVVNALFSVPALAQEGLVTINKSAEIERILALKKEMNKKMPFITETTKYRKPKKMNMPESETLIL
jgi:hypothetical protein